MDQKIAAFAWFWCHFETNKTVVFARFLAPFWKNSATTLQIQNTIVNLTIAGYTWQYPAIPHHTRHKCLDMSNPHLAGRMDRMVKAEVTAQLLCMGDKWAKPGLTD